MEKIDLTAMNEENELLQEQILLLQEKIVSLEKSLISSKQAVSGVKGKEKLRLGTSAYKGPNEVSFENANKLFLERRYKEAEEIYVALLEFRSDLSFVIQSFIERCRYLSAIEKDHGYCKEDFFRIFDNEDAGWSAVITTYKRQDYLAEQLRAIQGQTIPPQEIVIIQNESHMTLDPFLLEKYSVKLIKSDVNSLYFRWIVGYLLDSRYVCVFDDDVVPGVRWIESCIYTCEKFDALVGPSGRRAAPNKKERAWKSVENLSNNTYEFCDWVCNSYFFKKEWIKYIVDFPRYQNTQKTFDDIQLATTLKACASINTVVPPQFDKKSEWNGHVKREYGHDEHALWKRGASDHADQRRELIQKLNKANFSWVS